jgi:hypothetical protein
MITRRLAMPKNRSPNYSRNDCGMRAGAGSRLPGEFGASAGEQDDARTGGELWVCIDDGYAHATEPAYQFFEMGRTNYSADAELFDRGVDD